MTTHGSYNQIGIIIHFKVSNESIIEFMGKINTIGPLIPIKAFG